MSINDDNRELYIREGEIALGIDRENRHSAVTGEWYGPEPQPKLASPACACAGCFARFYWSPPREERN